MAVAVLVTSGVAVGLTVDVAVSAAGGGAGNVGAKVGESPNGVGVGIWTGGAQANAAIPRQ